MSTYQRLVLSLLCCILRRLIEGDKPYRKQYEALLLAHADSLAEFPEDQQYLRAGAELED